MPKLFLLQAKPFKAPKWWPRDSKDKPVWVGVLKGGDGWCLGDADPMTKAQVEKAAQVFEPKCRFRMCEYEGKETP